MLGLPYHIGDIARLALAQDLFQGHWPAPLLRQVAYDSRLISRGAETLFVALKSPHRDGHDFIADAYAKGVRNFMVDHPIPYRDVNYLICEDTLSSLQAWAMHHRLRFSYPVIGITGSNGKTTVKEWLATLLEMSHQLVKSPKSYNSQLGVPLSLLQMHPQADLAIIEAGISQQGEMAFLASMIQPTLGLLTHMGPAHAEGFSSLSDKLHEKAQLFETANTILLGAEQDWVVAELRAKGWPIQLVGRDASHQVQVLEAVAQPNGWDLHLRHQGQEASLFFPLTGQANLENALLAALAALELGMSFAQLGERFQQLRPVEMRMELISDSSDLSILNDSYNSDVDSVRQALQQLALQQVHPRKVAILSDIPHLGDQQAAIQRDILSEAERIADQVWTVGPVFQQFGGARRHLGTESLLAALAQQDFSHSSVLLKGARAFELERVIPLLYRKLNATTLRIDLDQLRHNFRWLQAHLPAGTKTMCMVKAASYGAGTWEIAQVLEQAGATYLAVAYASEGILLRQAGISLPIMVMNPDWSSIEALLQFDIEPEVSRLSFLQRYLQAARLTGGYHARIHLKVETGMGRLGFSESDMPALIHELQQHPDLQVISVMSHLAAADDPQEDPFTAEQVARFQRMYAQLQNSLGINPFRHIVNTAGLLRFPAYSMDMVRLGIGLYGIDPVPGLAAQTITGGLSEIGSLHSIITQIQTHPEGTSIGYGRAQRTTRPSRIATVPIGYADGVPRMLGLGRISFLVQGQWAPTFGRVCMDMLMLDVTDIPEAQAGDEVVLIGQQGDFQQSVCDVAKAADTIPYEILVRLGPRLRRIFVRE